MAIRPTFSSADVDRHMTNFLNTIEKRQVKRLQYLGEMCIERARDLKPPVSFMDQTGNLRSSIGYMVFKDGVAVHESFELVKEGQEGIKAAQKLCREIGSRRKKGIMLVVVAGMNYAIYVEAKGLDVLTSAEHLAEKELPKMIKDLVSNIKKATE